MPRMLSLVVLMLGIGLFSIGALSGLESLLTNQTKSVFHLVMSGVGIITFFVGYKFYAIEEKEKQDPYQNILDAEESEIL